MTKPFSPIDAGNISLLLLADILEEADSRHLAAREPTYNQCRWSHDCGTPACAIGHWLAHEGRRSPIPTDHDFERLQRTFAVSEEQWAHLFGYLPGHAETAKEEATRIRSFVASRSAQTVKASLDP